MNDQASFPPDLRQFVADEKWVFAKTYASTWPHEYIVRDRVDEALFVKLVEHIRANGYLGSFYKKKITYYDEDGLVYWTMGAPIDETTVINRCRKEQTYEYRLAHDDLPTHQIDITFDFRSDTPPGRDPDKYSATLRRYHKLLWSKPLPNGVVFELDDTVPRPYLYHRSEMGEYWLASDAVIPSFTRDHRCAHIMEQMPVEELDEFNTIGYTIGGMMVFPGNRIDRKMTINGARGFHPRIKDRFDLTVECIRRHYRKEDSPLGDTLARYADFFDLFGDFRGYVEFFLLQDLVTADFSEVRFFTPFDGFKPWPLPKTTEAYRAYKQHALDFIGARNRRILASTG